jgi:ribonucleoside-triphosphate reductase
VNDYNRFIYLSRYAKWNEDAKRRETWPETVARYCTFFDRVYPGVFPIDLVYSAVHGLEVVPSMRALMTAGPALERDNIAGYNCSYLTIDHPRSFDEVMYILMCGTGVGFSVEEHYVRELPTIADEHHPTDTTIVVADSRVGWASGLRELISLLYSGKIPRWDLSRVRPAGARLKTFGGRASGPEPLHRLFTKLIDIFRQAAGRKLTTVEAHDIVCSIADVVIVGGVRRSALISLSDLGDRRMAVAKTGQWWVDQAQRALANNSAVFSGRPDFTTFITEWKELYESKSGERGIYNRSAATKHAASNGRRETEGWEFGTNPCGEIILRPSGLCNLTEVIVRPGDDFDSLRRKVEVAAIIGTFQSTLTDFRYVRRAWEKNAREERLLGVSLTGIYDNTYLRSYASANELKELKEHAIETNREWARKLGIQQSVAVTCIKPSGTVSQLAGCSSGIHPSYSRYYYRTVRLDTKDPLCAFLQASGIRNEPEQFHADSQSVFYFPTKAPEGSVTSDQLSAKEHFKLYLTYRKYWCEHNPSTTIYYNDDEFLELGNLVWNNFDDIGGISFLPRSDHVYQQAPYIPISMEEYEKAAAVFPKIDWEKFYEFEKEDHTTSQHDLACSAGLCEL